MKSRWVAADGDHLRPVLGEPGSPRHRQHEANAVQHCVGEGHDVALDGRSVLGEPANVDGQGHVVPEDEVAGLRVVEANLTKVSSDEGPHVCASHEHGRVCALGRKRHDEHAFHCRRASVGVGGLDHEAKVGEPGLGDVVVQRELNGLQHRGVHEPWCIRGERHVRVVARAKTSSGAMAGTGVSVLRTMAAWLAASPVRVVEGARHCGPDR